MKELGEYLKETRENNGVSIEEASDDLQIDSFLLENLEDGNVRAFKDVLSMKEIVKEYAKYLGLNPEEVTDEFNDFLFEHTSKISLSDILEAENRRNKNKEEEKKVASPYTIIKKKKVNKKLVYSILGGLVILILLIILVIQVVRPKEEKITNELMGKKVAGDNYEFTY